MRRADTAVVARAHYLRDTALTALEAKSPIHWKQPQSGSCSFLFPRPLPMGVKLIFLGRGVRIRFWKPMNGGSTNGMSSSAATLRAFLYASIARLSYFSRKLSPPGKF